LSTRYKNYRHYSKYKLTTSIHQNKLCMLRLKKER
jgi:hypothetical protein